MFYRSKNLLKLRISVDDNCFPSESSVGCRVVSHPAVNVLFLRSLFFFMEKSVSGISYGRYILMPCLDSWMGGV